MKSLITTIIAVAFFTISACSINVGMRKSSNLQEVVVSQADGHDKILLLTVDGMISLEPGGTFFSREPNLVASLREQLDKARHDEAVRGVILRVNSPGGTLGASQMIYDELLQYRKDTGVYLLSLYMEIAASGALYLSMAADQIMAYPGTLTGSMGVIYISPNFQELGQKIGVQYRVVKTGARKDMGTPFRNWPPEEQRMLETLADGYNEQFKNVVFSNRKPHGMTTQNFEVLTDARVVSAEQAKKIHLIDELGNFGAAISNVEQKNGRGRMKVVAYTRFPDEVKTLYSRTYDVSAAFPPVASNAGGIEQLAEGVLQTLRQSTSAPTLSKGFYFLW